MRTLCCSLLGLGMLLTTPAFAEKMTLILDWHINPDHAAIDVAQQIGAFRQQGLDLTVIAPSDPALPPRLVAAKQADLAVTYQPQLYFFADQQLGLVRIATLIDSPLNSLITLDRSITSPAGLLGKKIGYSVSGIEQETLATMLQQSPADKRPVTLVNVNFQLTSALMAGQVDAVIGGYRNIEAVELKLQGRTPVVFNVEDYGVPAYDELIIVANRATLDRQKIKKFVTALQQGTDYLLAHPEQSWKNFATRHPELNNDINHQTWQATLPYLARHPARLDRARYQQYEQFLLTHHLINGPHPIDDYALKIH